MSDAFIWRAVRGALRRVALRVQTIYIRGGALLEDPPIPPGFTLVRYGPGRPADIQVAETAMVAAGEEPGLSAPRFAHGDEFFGWMAEGRVVAFAWATFRDRTTAGRRLAEAGHRVFLYNGHTLPAFRGHGLYTLLLRHMRRQFTLDGRTDVVGEVNVLNTISRKGLDSAGLKPVAVCGSVLLFRRWEVPLTKRVLDESARELF
jgi:GNAT superfamily N-acetyltransferase